MMGGGKGGEHRKRIKKGIKETFWNNPILLPWIYMCTLNGCNVLWASLIAQLVKNLPAMQETPVRFLGLEDPSGEWIGYPLHYSWVSLVAQLVKNLPAVWETWDRSLGWEDPLEKGKAAHSSISTWRIPWTV